jgi:hypothetical protein
MTAKSPRAAAAKPRRANSTGLSCIRTSSHPSDHLPSWVGTAAGYAGVMVEPGRDPRRGSDPTAGGFVPILGLNLVLFAVIALIVTKPGEQVIAWAVAGTSLVLLLFVLAWEVLGRRRDRVQ